MRRIHKKAVFPDDAIPELDFEVKVRVQEEGREGILSRGG